MPEHYPASPPSGIGRHGGINYKSIKRASSSAMQLLSDDMSLFSLLATATSGGGSWRVRRNKHLICLFRGPVWEEKIHGEGARASLGVMWHPGRKYDDSGKEINELH